MSRYEHSGSPQEPPRRRKSRGRRIVGGLAVLVTFLVTGAALTAYVTYLNTLHAIKTFSPAATLGNDRPPAYNAALNILVVGSDSRAGPNEKFGKYVQGQRSDTMLLVHIRPDHRGAVVVSLPRDTEVPVYACAPDGLGDPGQQAQAGQTEMLNATFAFGGPPCLWKTVEQLTGIRIDHYLGLTFTGFEKVINDLGGVNVCLPIGVKDPKSGLNLTAGRHHVMGREALAFWRERYVGDGSDLQRIQRQQYLMAGLMQELKSGHLLSDYTRMYSVLQDAARALTTDQGLSLSDMVSLAEDLRHLPEKSVQFVTVPNTPDPQDPDRVVWRQPQANDLFYAIAHDTALPRTSHRQVTVTVAPGKVQVEVLNGNGVQGAAAQAASELSSRGFDVLGSTNAPSQTYTSSVIEYSAASELPAVDTLRAQVAGAQAQQVPGIPAGTVDLILGSSFSGLASQSSSSSSSSSTAQNFNQSYGGINASANICSDQGAFTGPDNPADGT